MTKASIAVLMTLVLIAGCSGGATKSLPEQPTVTAPTLKSGVNLASFDRAVRPQDDFYEFVNGKWLRNTEIPPDKSSYGTFIELYDETQENLRIIIEESAAGKNAEGSEAQKVGDFFNSFMDTALIEELGLKPLEKDLEHIRNINNYDDLLKLVVHLRKKGIQTPFLFYINQDEKNTVRYIVYLTQSGLGLPDRDYYFKEEDKFKEFRTKYVEHITKILDLAGETGADEKAGKIMEIETGIAEHHWTRVENRDRDKTYNKHDLAQLNEVTPNFSWNDFYAEAGLTETQEIVVRQPSYLDSFGKIWSEIPVEDWKTYFTWKVLDEFAAYLPREFDEANFNFYRKTLRGVEKQRPRWKRGVVAVNGVLGEAVGKIYVRKHFKLEAKERMNALVGNLERAFEDRIHELEWMSPATKKQALLKLSKFTSKIGYPDKWKDYSKLVVKEDELVRNYIRANKTEYQRDIDRLGKPIDRTEWFMTPQTINAYYNPPMNEVVFPAAILQPPFFDMEADDAINYGAICAVIGHELSHGFDDQGRKSDGDGNLRDWWTEEDAEKFRARSHVMIDQFNDYYPLDSVHVNGELTLGENIGDFAGLTISYKAYKMSLNGKEAPVIDDLTGDQRFFIGWAQVWRRVMREEEQRRRIVTDPHSPGRYRVIGAISNMPEFYEAFDVREGDGMYIAPEKRAKIW